MFKHPKVFGWINGVTGRIIHVILLGTCKKLKILGIVVGNNVSPEDNWGSRMNKIHCILEKQSKPKLTYYGKAVIVNTLVGAGINYLGSVVACPTEFEKKIDFCLSSSRWRCGNEYF